MRKMTAWSVGELAISIEENKIAKGIGTSNQIFATRRGQRGAQIRRPFRAEFHRLARPGVAECQSSRVQRLPRRSPLECLGHAPGRAGDPSTPAPAVYRVAHDGVADVL